jgi:hypothetical protein
MNGWADAVQAAGRLQASYPGWRVRAVSRHSGPGVEANRDSGGVCSVIGTPAEVEAELARTAGDLPA